MHMALEHLKLKFKYPRRVREAAQQMWDAVKKGYAFEIPASLSTDDATTKAVLCLQEMHPDCPVAMLQSRGIVIGKAKTAAGVSQEAWGILAKHDYFPDPNKAASAEKFIEQHEAFMQRNLTGPLGGREDKTVEDLVREAQEKQAAHDMLVVGQLGGDAVTDSPTSTVTVEPESAK